VVDDIKHHFPGPGIGMYHAAPVRVYHNAYMIGRPLISKDKSASDFEFMDRNRDHVFVKVFQQGPIRLTAIRGYYRFRSEPKITPNSNQKAHAVYPAPIVPHMPPRRPYVALSAGNDI